MWTIIDGFDRTDYIPFESIDLTSNINDPQPQGKLDVEDPGSQLSFVVGMEVIIFEENAAPTYRRDGTSIPTVPSHNALIGFPNNGTSWIASGSLSSLIAPNVTYTMTFNNSALGTGSYYQITQPGHIHPGQKYMFSMYLTMTTQLVNANVFIQIDFLDASKNVISGSSVQLVPQLPLASNAQYSVSGVAPTGAMFAKASFGGSTTVASSNAGVVIFGSPQLDPMWFANRGITYPTPDNNIAQVASAQMPDGTFSRQCRVFSGFINDWQIEYPDGTTRVWHLTLTGPGALLDSGLVNSTFSSQYDDQILTSVVNTYFSGQISLAAPNTSSPSPVQRGSLIDAISYSDNTLRDVLNGLVDYSGFMFYVDWYYALRYNPSFYAAAGFSLTDGVADNTYTFNFYDFTEESDGTQIARRIKVVGGNFIAPAISDTFSGNGSTKTFSLSQQPYNVQTVTVGGVAQKTGVKGVNTLGTGGIVALVDKANQQLIFQTAPASGTNNVVITYTYQAPVTVQVVDNPATLPIAPTYALPFYDSKVNDSNLTSLAAATQRGLAELSKYGEPLAIIKLSVNNAYANVGTIINVTHQLSGLNNTPFVVQQLEAKYLGNGINEYIYQLGAYQPNITDHLRNANKASNRSTTTANIYTPQQIDVVAHETMAYSDSIVITVQSVLPQGIYGTAKYGQISYGGMTGTYGTARYNSSYIYG